MQLHFLSICIILSLHWKDVDMWNPKEKHSEHDSSHSKRHRDGVHIVLCGLDAKKPCCFENECDIHKDC